MMNFRRALSALFFFVVSLPFMVQAQSTPAPQSAQSPQLFVAPPELQPTPRHGNVVSLLSTKVQGQPQKCNPAGDISQTGNVVSVNLVARMDPNSIYNPGTGERDQVKLRSYGGCLTGPQLDLTPGSTLRIYLDNQLDAKDPTCPDGQDPPDGSAGCLNTINMHFHGLHVSPSGNSDNVLLNIAPQTKFQYEINIPGDHPAGTFWYHAHRHGSTSTQVASGESGALIIHGNRQYTGEAPGDVDTILHDASNHNFTERVLIFQQIPYACFTNDSYSDSALQQRKDGTWYCNPGQTGVVENFNVQLSSPTIWDTSGRFTSINGVVQPSIAMRAGEIERWRMVHAGIHDTINLQIVPMVLSKDPKAQLALEGIFKGTPQEQARLVQEVCPSISKPDHPVRLIPQFEIASDGLTRTAISDIGLDEKSFSGGIGTNFMQPGYRSDVLVVFPKEGTYCLLNQAATPSERANTGNGPGGQGPHQTELLATVRVTGGTPLITDEKTYLYQALYDGNKNDPGLPPAALEGLKTGDLTPWRGMDDLSNAKVNPDVQKVNFFIGNLPFPQPFPPNSPPFSQAKQPLGPWSAFGFYINRKIYDPERIDFTRQVGTTDDWILTADSEVQGQRSEPHIFHIHVNPFEIMDVQYQGKSIFTVDGKCTIPPDSIGLENQYCGMWHVFKDTVFVQPGYSVMIRTHYDRYIGEFVIHCHILDHEDGGMMTNVEIVPDLGAPGNGIGMPGMHSGHSMSHSMSMNNPGAVPTSQ